MRRLPVGIVLGLGIACFVVGVMAGRAGKGDDLGLAPREGEVRVIFDASSIRLLPDADLQLKAIRGFDQGAGGGG